MKVVVSACLLGVPCRYDGGSKPCPEVQAWLEEHDCEVVRICPEVMGGLSIPHPPHEIRCIDDDCCVEDGRSNGERAADDERADDERCADDVCSTEGTRRVVDEAGNDHTAAFEEGARRACEAARKAGCTHAILKAKSPSCGVGRVYDGTFTGTLTEGDGIAAAALREMGVALATEKDFAERFAD